MAISQTTLDVWVSSIVLSVAKSWSTTSSSCNTAETSFSACSILSEDILLSGQESRKTCCDVQLGSSCFDNEVPVQRGGGCLSYLLLSCHPLYRSP